MKPEREELLVTNIKARTIDARRHLEALEDAVAEFGDFEVNEFEAAWRSDDRRELRRAYEVQAGYENALNASIKVAQELAELEGWTPANTEPRSTEALKALHDNGVIDAKTRTALKDAQERRSDVQHDYVNVAAREIHKSVTAVVEHVPLLLQAVADQLRQRA